MCPTPGVRHEFWKAETLVDASTHALRRAAVDRLVQLADQKSLSRAHVHMVAQTLEVADRTVWRWVAARRHGHTPAPRDRFRIDDQDRKSVV